MGKQKYFTEEERLQAKKKAQKEASKRYNNSKKGRAKNLLNCYKSEDKKYNRGECTLTAEWIVEHIFSQPCPHCGESDWYKIGCNRLDNSKPHTLDNVEPCCANCNKKLGAKDTIDKMSKQVCQYTLDGELIAVYQNARIAADETGFLRRDINMCCNGGYNSKKRGKWVNVTKYKGYIWKFE